ncbi:MAG: YdjY domain-containing protein, partial [Planctomycetaceae bacterium]
FLQWVDEKGKRQRVPAQNWIRHVTQRWYEEPMETLPTDLTIPKDNELRYDRRNKELLWYGPMTQAQRDELLTLSADEGYQKAIRAFHDRSRPREMQAHWVFAGSGYTVDEQSGERFYQAEGGDFICVANFPSAMIDVAIKSSATGQDNLMYEAYTERIPPVGTEVLIELVPVFEKDK